MKTKINYQRDMIISYIGAIVMFIAGGNSISNGGVSRGIILLCLGGVMLGLGVLCLIKNKKNEPNNDKK